LRIPSVMLVAATLVGCSAVREIGVPPALSPVGSGYDTAAVAIRSYPEAPRGSSGSFSLWNDRQSKLFTDPRALSVGDILTVVIQINDRAKFENESQRSRTANRRLGLSGAFEVEGSGSSGSADFNIGSNTATQGAGATERSEAIKLQIAAVVTDVLPNGNLLISGSQDVRVNAELRILTIGGIVRPNDIGGDNTISYERIAEARISYGGRGRLTEVQQPPYGQQALDLLLPF
jgi:flagellar L-ring protein FlgH